MGVFAFAAKTELKWFAHRVIHALLDGVGKINAFSVHQLHFAGGRKRAVAGEQHQTLRIFQGVFGQFATLGFHPDGTLFAFNQTNSDLFAHAFQRAPHIGLHFGSINGAIKTQREKLVFRDLIGAVGIRRNINDQRAAAIEFIAASARQFCTFDRFEPRNRLRRAAYIRG